jgi:hypothetical protein
MSNSRTIRNGQKMPSHSQRSSGRQKMNVRFKYDDYVHFETDAQREKRISRAKIAAAIEQADVLKRKLFRDLTKKSTVSSILRNQVIFDILYFYQNHYVHEDKQLSQLAVGLKVRVDRFIPAFFGLCERYNNVFKDAKLSGQLVLLIKFLLALGYDLGKESAFALPSKLNQLYIAVRLSEVSDPA